MSYVKQTWLNGETITATKLNHMEDGIEGAYTSTIPVVTITAADNVYTMDMKAGELYAAIENSVGFAITENAGTIYYYMITQVTEDNGYSFTVGANAFTAASADDYPTYSAV